jgi:glycerol-3-phosphate acyltransferase PlsX
MPPRIAVDAMGGDHGAKIPVEAALLAAKEHGIPVVLVGDERTLKDAVAALGGGLPTGIEIVHAAEAIEMHEKPSRAVRQKREASLCVAARVVAEGKADAMVSAGNSGAVMAAGLFEIGRLSGVQRPAIGSAFPTKRKPCVILDLGANIDPTPVQLAQFAIMGEAYARALLHRERPKVALLTNGSEEVKGSDLTRAAHEILSKAKIDYVGYCEGRDVFEGEIDVIVIDGFCGNVLLKTLEGFVTALKDILEREIRSSIAATAGALLMRNIFGTVKRKLDYEEAGGAPLLGLEKNCLVAHGTSSVNALKNAIISACGLVETNLIGAIADSMRAHAEMGLWPKGRD